MKRDPEKMNTKFVIVCTTLCWQQIGTSFLQVVNHLQISVGHLVGFPNPSVW